MHAGEVVAPPVVPPVVTAMAALENDSGVTSSVGRGRENQTAVTAFPRWATCGTITRWLCLHPGHDSEDFANVTRRNPESSVNGWASAAPGGGGLTLHSC